MKTSRLPAAAAAGPGGFSLVEVAIAAGIASIGIIMLFGLLPSGLTMFRDSMTVSVSSQIAQRVIQEAVQTDYDVLVGATGTGSTPVVKPWRYFDDQGTELPVPQDAIYHVLTRVIPASQLPSGNAAAANASLATITVQVVANPYNRNVDLLPASATDPLAQTVDPQGGLPFFTYNSHVARAR
jgi:uncharacterized protein (TIGR02598 family)